MSWFTVVIPTRDSPAWIEPLLDLHTRHGIVPVILLGGRTRDNTAALVARPRLPRRSGD